MELFERLLAPLAAYPRWFVVTVWVLVKLIKWTLSLVLAAVLLLLILAAVAWLLGG